MSQETPLTEQEREQAELIQKRVAQAAVTQRDQLEKEKKYSKAEWKIQIWIKSKRSIHKPLTFTLSIWASGKRLHGGGDESAFFCRRAPGATKPRAPFAASLGRSRTFKNEPTNNGCGALIPGDLSIQGKVNCPSCGLQWTQDQITDSIFYQVPVEKAASIIADWVRDLNFSADLYCKYRDDDIRTKMMAKQFGVRKARQLKGMQIYPLVNLLKDTATGSTLEARIKAFLLS